MNQKFLDVLHDQHTEVCDQLHQMKLVINAMDTLGMGKPADRLWMVYESIKCSYDKVLNAYSESLHENVAASLEAAAQTFEAAFAISEETSNGQS